MARRTMLNAVENINPIWKNEKENNAFLVNSHSI